TSIRIVDHTKWVESVPGLPYQVPTIVRAQATQIIRGEEIVAAACAEPASVFDPLPAPGALSFSLPDGPVQGFTKLSNLFTDDDLNTMSGGEGTDMLTASNGDFPVDGGSWMSPMGWPTDGTNPLSHTTGEAWRIGFYDWIRRAGTKARISAVTGIQS